MAATRGRASRTLGFSLCRVCDCWTVFFKVGRFNLNICFFYCYCLSAGDEGFGVGVWVRVI